MVKIDSRDWGGGWNGGSVDWIKLLNTDINGRGNYFQAPFAAPSSCQVCIYRDLKVEVGVAGFGQIKLLWVGRDGI